MKKQIFHIIMKTPIGERYGRMIVEINEKMMSGIIDILGNTETFQGVVDNIGNFNIKGQIISLTRTIPYIATGHIGPTMIQLSLRGERNVFEVTGVPCEEGGEI